MNDQALISLIKILLKGSKASYDLQHNILQSLDPDAIAIWWHVDDVEHIASGLEEDADEPIGSIYDRSEFRSLLQDLVENSDEYGLTPEGIMFALEDSL